MIKVKFIKPNLSENCRVHGYPGDDCWIGTIFHYPLGVRPYPKEVIKRFSFENYSSPFPRGYKFSKDELRYIQDRCENYGLSSYLNYFVLLDENGNLLHKRLYVTKDWKTEEEAEKHINNESKFVILKEVYFYHLNQLYIDFWEADRKAYLDHEKGHFGGKVNRDYNPRGILVDKEIKTYGEYHLVHLDNITGKIVYVPFEDPDPFIDGLKRHKTPLGVLYIFTKTGHVTKITTDTGELLYRDDLKYYYHTYKTGEFLINPSWDEFYYGYNLCTDYDNTVIDDDFIIFSNMNEKPKIMITWEDGEYHVKRFHLDEYFKEKVEQKKKYDEQFGFTQKYDEEYEKMKVKKTENQIKESDFRIPFDELVTNI